MTSEYEKKRNEKWAKMPVQNTWPKDGVLIYGEEFYFCEECSFLDHCEYNELDPTKERLVEAVQCDYPELDIENWCEYFDCIPNKDLKDLVDEFNGKLSKIKPNMYREGKRKIVINWDTYFTTK